MNEDSQLFLAVLAEDREVISYRKGLRKITGSVTSAILLQQIIYWASKKEWKPFYKFRGPCSHKLYQQGDSWLEELGFTGPEFDNAIEKIGTKVVKGMSKREAYQKQDKTGLVIYWTDKSRLTWYHLNTDLLGNLGKLNYLVNKESRITLKSGKVELSIESGKGELPINLGNDELPLTETTQEITTEITTDTNNNNNAVAAVVFSLLDQLEIRSPKREDLAGLPHMTEAYLNRWIKDRKQDKEKKVGTGWLIKRLEKGDEPPEIKESSRDTDDDYWIKKMLEMKEWQQETEQNRLKRLQAAMEASELPEPQPEPNIELKLFVEAVKPQIPGLDGVEEAEDKVTLSLYFTDPVSLDSARDGRFDKVINAKGQAVWRETWSAKKVIHEPA